MEKARKEKKNKAGIVAWSLITLGLTVAAGTNLFGFRGVFLLVLLGLLGFQMFFQRTLRIDTASILVCFFCLSFTVVDMFYAPVGLTSFLLLFVLPAGFFVLGNSQCEKDYKRIVVLLGVYAFSYLISAVVNLGYSLANGAYISQNSGLWPYIDIWGKAGSSKTFFSIDLIPTLGFFTSFIIAPPKRGRGIWLVVSLAVFFGCISASIYVGNRSFILIAPTTLFLSLLFRSIKTKNTKTRFWMVIISSSLLVFGIGSFVALKTNLLGIQDYLSKYSAFRRFIDGGSDIMREHQYKCFWENWLSYPFGGLSASGLIKDWDGGVEATREIHNTFLQVYAIAGWPSFLLSILLFLYLVFRSFKSRETDCNHRLYFSVVTMIISMTLLFLFEPMITSEPFLVSLFFLLSGLSCSIARGKQSTGFVVGFSPSEKDTGSFKFVPSFVLLCTVVIASIIAAATESAAFGFIISVGPAVALIDLFSKKTSSSIPLWKSLISLTAVFFGLMFFDLHFSSGSLWFYKVGGSVLGWIIFVFIRFVLVSRTDNDFFFALRNKTVLLFNQH